MYFSLNIIGFCALMCVTLVRGDSNGATPTAAPPVSSSSPRSGLVDKSRTCAERAGSKLLATSPSDDVFHLTQLTVHRLTVGSISTDPIVMDDASRQHTNQL